MSREDLMQELEASWGELQSYLASLPKEAFTQKTDAAGWTVKDHAIHIAEWEKACLAMLEGKSKRETLNISAEVWEQDDDPINAVIQQRYQDMPLDEVLQTLQAHHDSLLKKLDTMTEEDLLLPYKHYQPSSSDERPMMDYLSWDTIHHYRDHIPWMKAIVEHK